MPPSSEFLHGNATINRNQCVSYFSTSSREEQEEEAVLEEADKELEKVDYSDDEFQPPPPIKPRKFVKVVKERSNPQTAPKEDLLHGDEMTEEQISYKPPKPIEIPEELMRRIETQEWQGGRMRAAQYGVLHEDPKIDMRLLMENYSVASLASALRDKEDALQQCAALAEAGELEKLKEVLEPHHPRFVLQRRTRKRILDVGKHLDAGSLEVIRKALMRMPRTVSMAHTQRAGVVIPLCIQNGVPSLLLEKRSPHLRAHPDEVCLPGGMVCSINDSTIVSTCLREMKEEIPGLDMSIVQVLGVLRCNWGEVHHLVGVAVTPVVCFLGDVPGPGELQHNSDEVAKVFTIPLSDLLESSLWVHKEDLAPIFIGGPEVIWGLTGYILEKFVKDIILPNHVRKDHHLNHHSLNAEL
jgi:ADP-ribose pyrophosphatase YjhB (NUDIX family)